MTTLIGAKDERPSVNSDVGNPEPERIVSGENMAALAQHDLLAGFLKRDLWLKFALHDIRQRFRRSLLGPFWITLSTGVMIASLSVVFGSLFGRDLTDFVPYVATGLIYWTFLSSMITEGCVAFIEREGYIRNVPMPLIVHFYRAFARNTIVLAHNMVIYVLVFVYFRHSLNYNYLLFIPGFLLFLLNLAWLSLLAALFSTRYRDIPQLINSVIQIVFFVTPVFWSVRQFPKRPAVIDFNPAYHLLEIVRAPLLGEAPEYTSWIVCSVMAVAGSFAALVVYRRAYGRLPYWV
ncbi:ABC transporter permease [Rhizobium sp.]|uniref:ABC transporter permease n=1 Tax=Rhizobium sp. TaxID=391 RepID=UPI0034C6966B